MAEEVDKEEESAEDIFSEAFDEDVAEEGGEEEAPTETDTEFESEADTKDPVLEKDEDVRIEEGTEEEAKDDGVEEKVEVASQDDDTDKGETLEQVNHKLSTLSGMYNSEIKKRQDAENKLALREGDKPKPEEEVVAAKAEDVEFDTSGLMDKISDIDSVKEITEEFGDGMTKAFKDVATMVSETVMQDMTQRLEAKFGKLSDEVTPLFEDRTNAADAQHYGSIETAHPDHEKYVENGELQEWITSRTSMAQKVYQGIYDGGSAEDVVDLYTVFKESKGYSAASEEKEEKIEKVIDNSKLEDMEAIPAKKSPVTPGKGGVSKDNYDAAWDAA